MIQEKNFTKGQKLLYERMSAISESCFCAGWIGGNEFSIWKALITGDTTFGFDHMDLDDLDTCKKLAYTLGGWIVWYDDEDDPSLPVEEWGPRFVTFEEWRRIVEKRGIKWQLPT